MNRQRRRQVRSRLGGAGEQPVRGRRSHGHRRGVSCVSVRLPQTGERIPTGPALPDGPANASVSALQVERYDPFGNKWFMMAPLRDGVSNAAVVSAKLKLFVFGGTNIHRDKASKVGARRARLACVQQRRLTR